MNIHKDSQDFCVMKEALTVRLDSCWPTPKLCKDWNFWLSESPTCELLLGAWLHQQRQVQRCCREAKAAPVKGRCCESNEGGCGLHLSDVVRFLPFRCIYKSQFCIFSHYSFASDQHSSKGHAGILSQDPVNTAAKVKVIVLISMKKLIMQTTIELSINQSLVNQYDKTTKYPVHHFQQLFESPSCSMLPDCL